MQWGVNVVVGPSGWGSCQGEAERWLLQVVRDGMEKPSAVPGSRCLDYWRRSAEDVKRALELEDVRVPTGIGNRLPDWRWTRAIGGCWVGVNRKQHHCQPKRPPRDAEEQNPGERSALRQAERSEPRLNQRHDVR